MTDSTARPFLVIVCSGAGEGDGGVHGYLLDPSSGRLRRETSTPLENPSFFSIHPDRHSLYAAERIDGGVLSAFEFDDRTGALEPLNRRSSEGESPCYVTVDPDGQFVAVVNYDGGTVAAYPIEADGRLGDDSNVVKHEGSSVDPDRQRDPHPHSVRSGPENRFAYAPDLGTDRIERYECLPSDGSLKCIDDQFPILEPAATATSIREGSGPRHLEFHPGGGFAYVVNELDSTVTVLERDSTTGALDPVRSVSTTPATYDGDNSAADVHVHPTGRWVYASNRGHDSIAIFATDGGPDRLRPLEYEATRGETPRTFAIAPTGEYLLVANQHGETVVVFRIGRDSGLLSLVDEVTVQKPTCVEVLRRR